jgi:hypothetical protein
MSKKPSYEQIKMAAKMLGIKISGKKKDELLAEVEAKLEKMTSVARTKASEILEVKAKVEEKKPEPVKVEKSEEGIFLGFHPISGEAVYKK